MDLISRETAIEALGECPENWTDSPEEIEAVNSWCFAANAINSVPSVHAVPLDKLFEFLGGAVTPCILLNIGCPYNEATRKDCDSCRAREAWGITLTKWMEEQDDTTGV